ncbi:MAG: serine/threonine-protein kinase [Candidatus Eremiobacterota bacterium]
MPLICECGHKNPNKGLYCSICGKFLHLPADKNFILKKRYEILALTGGGGMGTVYKARDVKLEKIWAVKECVPFRISQKKSDIEDIKNRFEREAKILARLDHPGLPVISDYFTENNRYYLVMTYIEGENLLDILKKDGNPGISEEKVTVWTKEILKILSYLHNQSSPVVYRDLKPANIILHKDGRIILVDFGIARVINPDDLTGQTEIGTKGYAPEEQIIGKAEPRSDIYALGATMHHLLTGMRPGDSGLKLLKDFIPSISDEMEKIVSKSLKEYVTDRFSCADEMLKALSFDGKGYERKVPAKKAVVISPRVTFIDKWEKKTDEPWYFNSPGGIAVDNEGYVYVADRETHRIQKFDSQGRLIARWGNWGSEDGEFNSPKGIVVDNKGYIYVSERGNGRIQKFDSHGRFIARWGTKGSKDGEFNSPEGIAVDNKGYIYVADTGNHRIQKFDSHGRFIARWGTKGSKDGEFSKICRSLIKLSISKSRREDGEFFSPKGIAVDNKGYIYVTDSGTHRIQKFDSQGRFIAGWGKSGSEDGEFSSLKGITVDNNGYVYVADSGNHRIQVFKVNQ